MKSICIKATEGLTLGKEYIIRNAFGLNNYFRLEVMNDFGVYEEYERCYFSKIY